MSRARKARQVNNWLTITMTGTIATGVISWAVGTEWSRLVTLAHGWLGVMVRVLTPKKIEGSVSTGLRRGRWSRWISILLGVLVLLAIGFGFAHSSGVWTGVGVGSPLWIHQLLAFAAVPLLLWHLVARESRPRRVDLDRRMLLQGGTAGAIAAAAVGSIETGLNVLGAKGADRRFTGSFEVGSGDPSRLPAVYWINDRPPDIAIDDWPLRINGQPTALADLSSAVQTVEAVLDCTGGWWSRQEWQVVSLSDVLAAAGSAAITPTTRSIKVTSATGYSVRFPLRDADNVFVAVGYGGEPLRRVHGAPIRIVAPGRRGPWWVKWVTEIELSERRWWLQSPFPTT